MFHYCPSCASPHITFEQNKRFRCPDCGFVYYHNTAAATGCVISTGETIVLLVRAKDPSKGKLDLPGGFVDSGEGALEGLLRELQEEIGWTPSISPDIPLAQVFTLFASFPNTYPYRNISYNTCDLFFSLLAPDLQAGDLRPEPAEISDIRFIKPAEINFEDIAFDSTRRALRAYIQNRITLEKST